MCLHCVSTGDVYTLQELSGCVSAFRESDSRGRLPLHAAAVQPQRDVLHVVLQGESSVQLNAVDVAVPGDKATFTHCYWCFCTSVCVHRADPGGADRGRGHVSDSGCGGRPGGER